MRFLAWHIILHPFAHLFGQLSRPATAVRVLQLTKRACGPEGWR
jgi:hypothetical protein